jgi:predicted transcriptional regulator
MPSPAPATPPKPTPAELEMLRLLYALGPATAKQVHASALDNRPDITYATVLRLLQVMHGKGLLTRDESARAHVYAPAQAQDSIQTSLLKELIHKAFSGSGKALVLAALRGGHVTARERAEIQALLDQDVRPD